MDGGKTRIKLDNRLRVLIENCVKTRQRSVLCLVGEQGRNQVVHLHNFLSKATVKARPNVLWCYKKELGFSTHRKKRKKMLEKRLKDGITEINENDPFELFICGTDIRWCYYKDTHKVLGKTFGMCVLQDFEAMTPNLLARTIETVEGGGMIIFLLKSLTSMKQLYALTMDVHARYRTEAHQLIKPRFNERFIMSLKSNNNCIFLDDKWNFLSISNAMKVQPIGKAPANEADERLKSIKEDLADTQPIGSILNLCKTYDQGNALLKFIDIITEKKFRTTVSLTAARGRGKSAALGLSIAAALAYGYANIFVTSPSPDNLGTLFEFVLKGLDALKYDQNSDYDIIQSTQDDMKKAIVRINLMRDHRQTVQYIDPSDHKMLAQAELVVIDEAAAIPLPLVKNLLGPYLVFMSSTVNGYEGTGRSLSLKLLDNLRRQADTSGSAVGQRSLAELTLDESIRYAPNCPVEAWLNSLLCLDCEIPRATFSLPSPSSCSLYWVNRDALFSGNKSSEKFLSSLMSLYVASHYKNQPNDLQLLSDAPAHHLFVLCAPVSTTQTSLPTPLVVIQVAHEGKIAKQSIKHSLREGRKASGDLIPWTVSEQFRQLDFGELSGARVVRIATHPDFQRAGYGKEALRQMEEYYAGKVPLADNLPDIESEGVDEIDEDVDLLQEKIQPKKELAIMYGLDQRRAERLDWLGVSFGLTSDLLRFWTRSGYRAVYMRQNANDTTGEHSSVFLKSIHGSGSYLRGFQDDFSRRFASLLGYEFRRFSPAVALQILETSRKSSSEDQTSLRLLKTYFTSYDLERMELYGKGVVDYHLIVDILPQIVKMIFTGELNIKGLSVQQKAILVALGLQYKSVDELAEISLTSQLPPMPASQILGHFKRAIIRINEEVKRLETIKAEAELDLPKSKTDLQIEEGEEGAIDAVLDEEAAKIKEEQIKEKQELVKALQQYKIKGNDTDWSQELSTRKSVSNISIGRERVEEKKTENGDVPVKRKGGKTPEGKKKKKKHG